MSNHVSAGLIESCNSQPSRSKLASLHGHLSGDHWLAGFSMGRHEARVQRQPARHRQQFHAARVGMNDWSFFRSYLRSTSLLSR